MASTALTLGWIAAVVIVPGWLALEVSGHRSRGVDRLGMAVGVSVAFWPLLLLWSSTLGVTLGSGMVQVGLISAAAAAACLRAARAPKRRGRRYRAKVTPETASLVAVLALAAVLRLSDGAGLVVPPWVDGLHHTVVTEAIARSGRLPGDLRPAIPIDLFYYHFGFHALAAAVSMASGATAAGAVLATGQAMTVLAAVTLYSLALRMLRWRAASVAAAAVPAVLFTFPAYFVSWSRFTQLAGLVVLPVAWILVAEAMARRRGRGAIVLAAAVAAGLVLTHYRVAVFFVLGVLVWAVRCAATGGHRRRAERLVRLAAVAALGAALAAPWLGRELLEGVADLGRAPGNWLAAPEGVDAVPSWPFTARRNEVWLALAALGLVVGLARRRFAALAIASVGVLAAAAARPDVLRLPTSWLLPPFSLAISLFLPVALGIGLLVDACLDRLAPALGVRRTRAAAAAVTIAVSLLAATQVRGLLNPATVIAERADIEAAAWIATHTPLDARFLVSTAHWHLGTYRGLDGGYWLPVLAGRSASVPPALYPYGDPDVTREITRASQMASKGDALTNAEISELVRLVGADFVYVGPAASGVSGKLSAERLARHPGLVEVYARDGVHVYRVVADSTQSGVSSAAESAP